MTGTLRWHLDVQQLTKDGLLVQEDVGLVKADSNSFEFKFLDEMATITTRVELSVYIFREGKHTQYVASVSWHGPMPKDPPRAFGRYYQEGAWAIVDQHPEHSHLCEVRIEGPNEQSVKALYLALRRGTVRPDEKEDWSKPQL